MTFTHVSITLVRYLNQNDEEFILMMCLSFVLVWFGIYTLYSIMSMSCNEIIIQTALTFSQTF